MFYFVKSPWLLKKMYSECIWNFSREEPVMYLTFDDGPHPVATPFVLDVLRQFDARATFFCIGKNVQAYPDIYERIIAEGHRVGNHTQHHVNGWKTPDSEYIRDVNAAARHIESNLFRPPYGRITKWQLRLLTAKENAKQTRKFRVIMWDVLSADFDLSISAATATQHVIRHAGNGSIVVFHDSEKALPKLRQALPETLKHFANREFAFNAIPQL